MKIEELRKLLQEATPGPWEAQIPAMTGEWPKAKIKPLKIEGRLYGFAMIKTPDAELIAAAVNSLPALLDIAETARALLDNHEDCQGACRECLADGRGTCAEQLEDALARFKEA